MSDLFHRMMNISDPIVLNISPQPKVTPEKDHSSDMTELLLTSEFNPSQDSSCTEDDSFLVYNQDQDSDLNVSVCNHVDMLPDTEFFFFIFDIQKTLGQFSFTS